MAYTSGGGASRDSLIAEMLSNFILVLGMQLERAAHDIQDVQLGQPLRRQQLGEAGDRGDLGRHG